MSDDIIARINARCAEAAAFARGAAEMKRRAIAACEACASDVTGTVSDADEAAQLAVAACVAAVRVTPWPTMTVSDALALAWGPLPSVAEVELGEETGVRAAGPIIEALDAAAVRLARENAALRDELRAARETIEARDAEYAATLTDAELDEHAVSTVEDVACLAAQLRGAKTTIAELLRADEGERAAREERWSKYLADVERLTAERDAAFNRGVEAMREAAAQHFKRRSEGIEHAAARIACIAPTAAVCATLDEARRVADVADEIRALEVAP